MAGDDFNSVPELMKGTFSILKELMTKDCIAKAMEGSSQPLFFWILLSLNINIALAALSVRPSDTVSVVGKDTYFDCASTIKAQSIHWYHYPIGSSEPKPVYGYNKFFVPYVGRFHIEINNLTGAYNLLITNVAEGDAGEYECQDDGGNGDKSKAQLIVLHSEPLCSSNMTSGEVIGNNNCGFAPEVVQFSCSVKYTGNVHPKLEWIRVGQNVPLTDGVTPNRTGDNETTTLTLKGVSSANGQSFTCRAAKTTFTSTEFFSCSSGVVSIWHATNNFSLTEKPLNEPVSCEEENSLHKSLCSYKWTKSDGKGEAVVSTEPTMRPDSSGIYRCTIDCTVKGQPCSINRMMVNVVGPSSTPQPAAQTSEPPDKSAFIIVLILLIIFIILMAVLGVIAFICRKRKRRYKSENSLMMKEKKEEIQKLQIDLEEERKKYKELKSKDAMEGPGFDGMLAKAQAQWAREKDVLLKRLEDLKKGPVGVEYSAKPKLIGTIMTTASKSDNKSIKGVALFNNELYIISQKESEVEVYDSTSLQYCRTWKLDELTCPEDACACTKNRCLYISENKQHVKEILRIDPNGKLINKWQIGNEFCRLSVSSETTVVAVVHDNSKLMEYSADGNHIRTHDLSLLNIQHPMHALKLKTKNYLVIHGYLQDKMHRLCEMDVGSNRIAKSFGGEKGGGDTQLSNPTCLAIDREGSVMVADATNGRVVLLGSNFEFKREVITKEDGISIPTRILLDEINKRLYVGDYKSKNRVLYAFEIE